MTFTILTLIFSSAFSFDFGGERIATESKSFCFAFSGPCSPEPRSFAPVTYDLEQEMEAIESQQDTRSDLVQMQFEFDKLEPEVEEQTNEPEVEERGVVVFNDPNGELFPFLDRSNLVHTERWTSPSGAAYSVHKLPRAALIRDGRPVLWRNEPFSEEDAERWLDDAFMSTLAPLTSSQPLAPPKPVQTLAPIVAPLYTEAFQVEAPAPPAPLQSVWPVPQSEQRCGPNGCPPRSPQFRLFRSKR